MISLIDYQFGPHARNRLPEATDLSADGAVAALESFYYALNHRDLDVMASVWSHDKLAQLNNPVGGILRGGDEAVALYRHVFESGMRLQVTFSDAVTYMQPNTALFAGREMGTYSANDQPPSSLEIRTSRFFGYDDQAGRWLQLHHHGSIDDPRVLRAYQLAVRPS